ncbi:MAG: glycoside hydrolase family 3 N-terminal domain-containing protein [Cytophagales bacterium]
MKLQKLAGLSLLLAASSLFAQQSTKATAEKKAPVAAKTAADPVEAQIDALLKKMSIEEKVGQMTQVNVNLILKNGYGNTDAQIDPAALKKAVVDYKVGSILNALYAYDVDTWHKIITQIMDECKNTPNKIPVLYGIDAIHGVTFTANSTLFPHNINLGASRNAELAKLCAKATAKETRASGIRWNFNPVLDVGRQPLWSRFPETFGEDTYIAKTMGSGVIRGYEEDGLKNPTAVASCMKHYIGYSNPKSGKDRTPILMSDVELREYYLPPFKAAVDAGSSTVMINSSEINGTPVHASKYLLTDVLRKELGFKGLAVSDWEDIIRLYERHRVASSPREAVKIAVLAGIDMSMVPHDYTFFDHLVDLVKKGEVPMSRIDEANRRILRVKFNTGLFENPYPEANAKALFGLPEYSKLALDIARESIVLLKNEKANAADAGKILPLTKGKKVFIAGPGGNNITNLHGCWSYSWQGDNAKLYPKTSLSIQKTLENYLGASNVVSMSYEGFDRKKNFKTDSIAIKSKDCDVILLCLGEDAYAEQPGVIDDLMLPQNQIDLAKAAFATGKPVVLVLTEGRPRIIREIEPNFAAILQAGWPGSGGAQAIVDILYGEYNPDAKLPYTYPQFTGDLMTYDHKFIDEVQELTPGRITYNGYKPQYPFGHGLSYTTFEYSNIKLSSTMLTKSGSIKVSVDVKNTGSKDGKVAVELYSRDLFASITPSVKRLRAFNKIFLKAGESKTVEFTINKDDLAFVNANSKTVTEAGEFEVMIDKLTAKFNYVD